MPSPSDQPDEMIVARSKAAEAVAAVTVVSCPFVVRIFLSAKGDKSIRPDLLADPDALPEDEINVYCYPETTLRELTDLIKMKAPSRANHAGARLALSVAVPTSTGTYSLDRMGTVHEFRTGRNDDKTLQQVGFEIGDYVCGTIA